MKLGQAESMIEGAPYGNKNAAGKHKAYMAVYQKTTEPVSGRTASTTLTIHRKSVAGATSRRTYRGASAERGYARVSTLANKSNPKVILKRTTPQTWGSVERGHTFTHGFERRAGK